MRQIVRMLTSLKQRYRKNTPHTHLSNRVKKLVQFIVTYPYFIMSFREFPGGTIGLTLSSLSMINSITVGVFVFCFALIKAVFISSGFVTRMPFAPIATSNRFFPCQSDIPFSSGLFRLSILKHVVALPFQSKHISPYNCRIIS